MIIELVAILLFILANGFFALSEFSVIASRRSKLRQDAKEGKTGAATAEKLNHTPKRFLATIQVGVTLFTTLAGVFSGATLVEQLDQLIQQCSWNSIAGVSRPLSVGLVTLAITIAAVILGELVPKYLALSFPERYARRVARPIMLIIKLSSFFSNFLSNTASLLVRLMGVKSDPNRTAVSEEEINLMIIDGREKGIFNETEEKLIRSVFGFADSTVRRAMIPRTDVIGIEQNTKPNEIIRMVMKYGRSRYPIFAGTIDHVVGVLYVKDLVLHKLDPKLINLRDLIRKPAFVPDSMPLSKLLSDFQRKKSRLAIVLDEFGGTAGIITLQDVLEELVGEIQDEDETGSPELVKHSETVAYADGSVWPGAINELMNSNLPEDKVETLAGLVIDSLGRLPKRDETIQVADMKITVLEQINNRVTRLKLTKIDPNTSNDSDGRENVKR